MRTISKIIYLKKFYNNNQLYTEALIEYNNNIDEIFDSVLKFLRQSAIDAFYPSEFVNKVGFGTLLKIFDGSFSNNTINNIRDVNEANYFNKKLVD